jgi:hypothetical protein
MMCHDLSWSVGVLHHSHSYQRFSTSGACPKFGASRRPKVIRCLKTCRPWTPSKQIYMNYSWHLGLHSFTLHQTPCRSMLPGRLSTFIGSASIIAGADLHLCTTCSCKIQDSWYVCPSAGHNINKLLMGEHVWELRIAPTFQVTQKGCQKSENMTLLMQILDQWFPRSACTFFLGKTKIMIVAAAA